MFAAKCKTFSYERLLQMRGVIKRERERERKERNQRTNFQCTRRKSRGAGATFYAGPSLPSVEKGVQGAEVHDMKASLCRARARESDRQRERKKEKERPIVRGRSAVLRKGSEAKKKPRLDNRPISSLAENTENRESTSLLLSSSRAPPFSFSPSSVLSSI